jgi:hypothetical protein
MQTASLEEIYESSSESQFKVCTPTFSIQAALQRMSDGSSKTPLWTSTEPHMTNVAHFIQHVNARRGLRIKTYQDLHKWSAHPSTFQHFWEDAYHFLGLSSNGQEDLGPALEAQVWMSFSEDSIKSISGNS